MANSGISDKIQVLEESTYGDGGVSGEVVFGVTRTFAWNADASTTQTYGLEQSGPQATHNVDGVLVVTGTHEWELTDGRELKSIFGSLTDTNPTFSLDVSNSLPSYSVKAVDEAGESEFVIIKGIKYGNISVNLNRGETIVVSAEWTGQVIEDTSTFTPTVSTVTPLTYLDGCVKLGGTNLAEVDSFNMGINRNVQGFRFIEQTTSGSRRLISEIVEGPLNLTFDGSAIAQRDLLEELFGSTTLQDVRTNKNIELEIARGTDVALTLTYTGGRFVSTNRTLEKSAELALQDFAGVALDITGSGTY